MIGIQCSERNGPLVAAVQVTEAHELMLISNQGTLVRTRVAEVSQLSRNTQGVTLIKLPNDESLVSVVRLEAEEDNGEDIENAVSGSDQPPAVDGGGPAEPGQAPEPDEG